MCYCIFESDGILWWKTTCIFRTSMHKMIKLIYLAKWDINVMCFCVEIIRKSQICVEGLLHYWAKSTSRTFSQGSIYSDCQISIARNCHMTKALFSWKPRKMSTEYPPFRLGKSRYDQVSELTKMNWGKKPRNTET